MIAGGRRYHQTFVLACPSTFHHKQVPNGNGTEARSNIIHSINKKSTTATRPEEKPGAELEKKWHLEVSLITPLKPEVISKLL